MNIFASPRRSGRTTQAINWLREDPDNRRLVVMDAREAFRLHKEYELPESCFWTFADLSTHRTVGQTDKKIIMDNADYFLQHWLENHAGPGNEWEAVIFEDTSDKLLTKEQYHVLRHRQLDLMREKNKPFWLRDVISQFPV